jgi:glycosyltransferase involved in cell wall biosynthesis
MLRLDVLSPLPPVRSGISDYTVDLLPALAARADVRVVALPEQPVDPAVAARWRPVPYAEAGYGVAGDVVGPMPAGSGPSGPAREGGPPGSAGLSAPGGRLPLYQMGNNGYHRAVEAAARRIPGVLVLHDLVLHHLALADTMGRDLYPPYEARLVADHGELGRRVARPLAWGVFSEAAMFALPAHRSLLRAQRGVVVHSRWAAEQIREGDETIAVRPVAMPIPLPPPADPGAARSFRERFGIPSRALVLGSFGFQTPIKRPEVVLAALAARALADVHLLVVGEASPSLDLDAMARAAGVRERVHLLGFQPFAELEAGIAAADLCLNLRYPTAGETSASLLRVLAVGRPVIVSAYAQFAELPAEVAVRVPVGDGEVAALVAALLALAPTAAGPNPRALAMGEAARAYVAREHDPERSADALVAACAELARRAPPGPGPAPVPVPSSETWSDLPLALAVRGAEPPWPDGEARTLTLEVTNRSLARLRAGRSGTGGVVFEVNLWRAAGEPADREDLLAGRPWLALPRDLAPGERLELPLTVRRPPGAAGSVQLRVAPHVLGRARLDALQLGPPARVAGEPEPPYQPPAVVWEATL